MYIQIVMVRIIIVLLIIGSTDSRRETFSKEVNADVISVILLTNVSLPYDKR